MSDCIVNENFIRSWFHVLFIITVTLTLNDKCSLKVTGKPM